MLRHSRILGLVVGAFAIAALAAAAIVRGGTSTFAFSVTEVPSQVTVTNATSGSGLAFAKFTPDASSGAATHTTITLTFKSPLTPTQVTSGCNISTSNLQEVDCSLGTVNPGQTVKVFVTFSVAPGSATVPISAAVTGHLAFDVSGTGQGGGGVSGTGGTGQPPNPTADVTLVDGTAVDGTCHQGGTTVHTAPVSTTVVQTTSLQFGDAASSLGLPCAWGIAGIGAIPSGLQTQVSFVSGPQFAGLSTVTIAFNGLPVPLSKFVLNEDPLYGQTGDTGNFQPVPRCPTPLPTSLPTGQDTCLIGYTKSGKVVTATLLYSGTGGDPGYAG